MSFPFLFQQVCRDFQLQLRCTQLVSTCVACSHALDSQLHLSGEYAALLESVAACLTTGKQLDVYTATKVTQSAVNLFIHSVKRLLYEGIALAHTRHDLATCLSMQLILIVVLIQLAFRRLCRLGDGGGNSFWSNCKWCTTSSGLVHTLTLTVMSPFVSLC